MAYPVTLNGRTYTLADFEGLNYVSGFPDALESFVTHAGNVYSSTSTTSVAIGTGSKTFTIADSGKPYVPGTPLRFAAASDPSNKFMDGVVTSYSGTTVVLDVKSTTGSGTLASWNVSIGGGTALTSYNLSGLTVTPTELNILDGDKSATSTTLADADRVVVNDSGTMVQVAMTDFQTYFQDLAISGGTIENTVIGASTAAAGSFTQVDIEATGDLRLQDTTGGQYVALQAPGTISSSYTLTMPTGDGTSGQFLTTDGSGALSFADAGGGGVNTFTANEALSAGDLVSLRSDGNVEKTGGFAGTLAEFESGGVEEVDVAFDSTNNKVVICYRDVGNSNYGTAVVGTVASDDTISFGTPVVYSTVTTTQNRIVFDPDSGKVVIAYAASSNGKAIVGTVSGTSISFGSEATWLSSSAGAADNHGLTYDTNVDRVVIVYRDTGNSNYGTANVGTISGTSISFGTPAVYRSANSETNRVTFCSDTNRIAIIYRDAAASNKLAGFSATATTTTVGTFSSRVEFTESSANQIEAIFDSNSNKVIAIARVNGVPEVRVITVTSSAISSGTAVQAITTSGVSLDIVMNTNNNKVVVILRDSNDSSDLKFTDGTISGSTVAFGSTFDLYTGSNEFSRLVFDSNLNKTVAVYKDSDDSGKGKALTINPATNIGEWIGFAQTAISSGSDGSITTLGGINENQSGLAINSKYYVQNNGLISTTEVTGRLIGRATSASNIYVTEGVISL